MPSVTAKAAAFWIGCLPLMWSGVAVAQTSQVYQVCHGQYENECKRRFPEMTYHEPCGSPVGNNGANPAETVKFLCGTKPGGVAKGAFTGRISGQEGNQCGYSWFEVRCY